MNVLTNDEIRDITLKAKAQNAFEQTRGLSLKGWLMVILPITLVLVLVLAFGVQESTGIQLYSLLNDPIGSDGKPMQEVPGGTGKIILARALLGLIAVSAAIFLWTMWKKQGGAAGFLVGGRIGRSAAFQADLRALQQSESDAHTANALLNASEQSGRAAALAKSKEAAQQLQQMRSAATGIATANGQMNDVEELVRQNQMLFGQSPGQAAPPPLPTAPPTIAYQPPPAPPISQMPSTPGGANVPGAGARPGVAMYNIPQAIGADHP